MPAPTAHAGQTPSLSTFLQSLKTNDIESCVELFISLLKRRQIRNSRPCALATTHLLLRVVAADKTRDAQKLIERIRHVGRRLIAAQPRETAVGNIVRRVLGVLREVADDDQEASTAASEFSAPPTPVPGESTQRPHLPTTISEFSPLHGAGALPHDLSARLRQRSSAVGGGGGGESARPPLLASSPSYAGQGPQHATSLFNILQNPAAGRSPMGTPPHSTGTQSPVIRSPPRNNNGQTPIDASIEIKEKLDIRAEVIDGIKDLLEELDVVDAQIAESALEHIHSDELILTHTSSQTVQKFLLTAAKKRSFTLFHAEAYPNDHLATHATILHGTSNKSTSDSDADDRWKPLTALGVTVVLIPDTAVFALMSRISKVLLAPHSVLADGSLVAAAGASSIALAARAHRVPVVVLAGVYKLSPVFPFDREELMEWGDPGRVVPFQEGDLVEGLHVGNPVYDFVEAGLVSLYVTNLGACAPSFLYRIVADHYRVEDIDLGGKE